MTRAGWRGPRLLGLLCLSMTGSTGGGGETKTECFCQDASTPPESDYSCRDRRQGAASLLPSSGGGRAPHGGGGAAAVRRALLPQRISGTEGPPQGAWVRGGMSQGRMCRGSNACPLCLPTVTPLRRRPATIWRPPVSTSGSCYASPRPTPPWHPSSQPSSR